MYHALYDHLKCVYPEYSVHRAVTNICCCIIAQHIPQIALHSNQTLHYAEVPL